MISNLYRRKLVLAALGFGVIASTRPSVAGGSFSGATEPTQILNNIELLGINLSSIKQVALAASQLTTQINQYVTMLTNLQNLPGEILQQVLGPSASSVFSTIRQLNGLYTTITGVFDAARRLENTFETSINAIRRMNINPVEYLKNASGLARSEGGVWKQVLEGTVQDLKTLEQGEVAVRQYQSSIPNIKGNLDGLQTLASGLAMTNNNLLGLRSELYKQTIAVASASKKAAEAEAKELDYMKEHMEALEWVRGSSSSASAPKK
mgnify:CR=1 FL=1|jgi:P-type conjugative transfer protein TrbJ